MASKPTLTAVYKSPLTPAPHVFSQPLPTPTEPPSPSPSAPTAAATAAKSLRLAALRAALAGLQQDVNAFLTERMQAEKKAEDAAAEEQYGEEEGGEEEG